MLTVNETYEQRWARRDAKLQERLADIPSRFTNEALYEERPVGWAVQNAEHEFFGTSFDLFQKQVRKAAQTVAWQWPGVLEVEDAEQELWLSLMGSPGSVAKLRDSFDDKNRLSALIQMAHQIANKAFNENQIATGNFRYSVNTVKQILHDAAEQERNPDLKLVNRSNLFSLRRGMENLRNKNAVYAEAISSRYRDGKVPAKGAAASSLSRALTALTTHMNRSYKQQYAERQDGPGTRKVISNAAAWSISDSQYNGDELRPPPGAGHKYWETPFRALKGGEKL
jgi:hypothetical protein